MNILDPKWLDILKVNGFKTCALAVSFGLFIFAEKKWGLLPASQAWMYPIIVLFFLISTSLCFFTILEFFYRNVFVKTLPEWLERFSWERKIRTLSDDAKKLLSLLEIQSYDTFYYLPKRPEIAELRNAEIIYLSLISDNGEKWGQFKLLYEYEMAYMKNRGAFRLLLKYSDNDLEDIRKIMMGARRLANGRI